MEVKPGYKQTEVGVIPVDWGVKPLGYYATFKTGPFGSILHRSDYVDDGIPVINPMQIIEGKLVSTSSMTINETAARKLAAFRLSAGDVVIGRRGDMGRCARVLPENDGWLCGTGSMIVTCRSSLNSDYLQRVLSSPAIVAAIENASVGTTMVNINNSTLNSLLIQTPPTLEEQEAIAAALSDADGLIESLEKLNAKKRHIKHGTMQELLTGKRRLPGFAKSTEYKQTEIGVIPEDWDSPRIGSVCKLINGRGFKPYEWRTSGLPIIRIQNLNGNAEFNYYQGTYDKKLEVETGDLLFAWSGSRGTSFGPHVWYGHLGLLNYHTWKIVLHGSSVSKNYFLHALRQLTTFIEDKAHGASALVHTQKWEMEGFRFPMPPTLAEQNSIAAILSDMDAEIAALEAKLAKAQGVKQGMMQELLTGKIRLV